MASNGDFRGNIPIAEFRDPLTGEVTTTYGPPPSDKILTWSKGDIADKPVMAAYLEQKLGVGDYSDKRAPRAERLNFQPLPEVPEELTRRNKIDADMHRFRSWTKQNTEAHGEAPPPPGYHRPIEMDKPLQGLRDNDALGSMAPNRRVAADVDNAAITDQVGPFRIGGTHQPLLAVRTQDNIDAGEFALHRPSGSGSALNSRSAFGAIQGSFRRITTGTTKPDAPDALGVRSGAAGMQHASGRGVTGGLDVAHGGMGDVYGATAAIGSRTHASGRDVTGGLNVAHGGMSDVYGATAATGSRTYASGRGVTGGLDVAHGGMSDVYGATAATGSRAYASGRGVTGGLNVGQGSMSDVYGATAATGSRTHTSGRDVTGGLDVAHGGMSDVYGAAAVVGARMGASNRGVMGTRGVVAESFEDAGMSRSATFAGHGTGKAQAHYATGRPGYELRDFATKTMYTHPSARRVQFATSVPTANMDGVGTRESALASGHRLGESRAMLRVGNRDGTGAAASPSVLAAGMSAGRAMHMSRHDASGSGLDTRSGAPVTRGPASGMAQEVSVNVGRDGVASGGDGPRIGWREANHAESAGLNGDISAASKRVEDGAVHAQEAVARDPGRYFGGARKTSEKALYNLGEKAYARENLPLHSRNAFVPRAPPRIATPVWDAMTALDTDIED